MRPAAATATGGHTSWPRFIASLLVLMFIVVGIPAGLISVARLAVAAPHPLPGLGSWHDITTWLTTQRSSTEIARAALRILIALCWLLWAALAVSVLSMIVAARPRFDGIRLPHLTAFDSIGTWIVAGLMVVSSFHPKIASAAPIGPRPAVATIIGPAPATDTSATYRPVVQTPTRAGWAVVQPGESIETFSARTLGDATRWTDVWELNQGRRMDDAGTSWREPWRISAGWELQLPAAGPTPVTAATGPQLAANVSGGHDEGLVDTADPVVHRIVAGDTLWDIVDTEYGHVDMDLVWFVADLNQVADPNNIPIGTVIELPPEPDRTASRSEPAPVLVDGSVAAHRIVHGDTLWDIVDAEYGHVDMDLVWFVADFNQVADPNNIPIGTVVQLPPEPGSTPAAPVPPPPPQADAPVETPEPAPPPAQPTAQRSQPTSAAPAPGPTPPMSAPADTRIPATSDQPTQRINAGADVDAGGFDFSVRSLWWQVPCGSLLAAGLVTMVRRLRGRRWLDVEPGQQLAAPPPVAAGTELAATTTGAIRRVATLTRLLQSVTPHARELHDPPPVRAVEFDDTRVEVLFSSPAPFPPSGWATADGGRSWVHLLNGDPRAESVRQLVTPALVTVGIRDGGGEVLLDIETAGSTGLVGDHGACLELARSITLELATYPLGIPMDVCLIGVDVDGVEHCDRAWGNTTMTRAVRVAREMLERTNATDDTSLLAARASIDDDEGLLDPQVFVVDRTALNGTDVELLDDLVDLCQPQAGAALVVIGGHPAARETITVEATGAAVWAGATLIAPLVSREAAAQAAVTFEHAANAPVEPLRVSPAVADLLDPRDQRAVDDAESDPAELDEDIDDAAPGYQAPAPDVVVRVMGEVTVIGGDVQLTADQTELLTLLLCLRDERPNADTVATSLDATRKSIQNRISSLRSRLGVGSDGRDLLPVAIVGRGSDGRYRPSLLMMTDVDLLEHRYRAALQLPSQDALAVMRDGLSLMSGPAFRSGKGYSWAAPEGVQARIAAVVNAYATRLMHLALAADALDVVLETVRRAETVIDDVVAETPLHRVEREIADATGHPALREGVASALRRLSEYVDGTDHLIPNKP